MEFQDLNDEIIADDWLIPAAEITRKKLIRQTPRHNIYKADWFGEVLVYEPVNRLSSSVSFLPKQESPNKREKSHFMFDQEELNSRLNTFTRQCNERTSKQKHLSTCLVDCGEQQIDSAYSSISSSPQYDTKNTRCEFEFPNHASLTDCSISPKATSIDNNKSNGDDDIKKIKKSDDTLVVLNKDSFISSQSLGEEQENEKKFNFPLTKTTIALATTNTSSSSPDWFELNELRLVAHESFMLFMGASIVEKTVAGGGGTLRGSKEQSTSLVMQMNHPKAISLYNLLHANKFNATPITDRLPKFKHSSYQPLSVEAKLNICQQVTNAMTYLHDKQIVHGKLTSLNIYIEFNQRVKISLIDNSDEPIATSCSISHHDFCANTGKETRTNECCSCCNLVAEQKRNFNPKFNLPSLTYLSPELIKSIEISDIKNTNETRVKFDTNQLTKSSDIFSFGTLLYELFEERFPFGRKHNGQSKQNPTNGTARLLSPCIGFSPLDSTLDSMLTNWNGNIEASASEIIYKIGSGLIETNLKDLNQHTQLVRSIISACWSIRPAQRPQFKQFCFA